ncbi:hypothetical protein [Psychromonas sp. MB-3u-54]|nr:hypothetical protein [Psychromonas sp. MB-3u-54]
MAEKFTEDGNDKNYLTKKITRYFLDQRVNFSKGWQPEYIVMINKSRIL